MKKRMHPRLALLPLLFIAAVAGAQQPSIDTFFQQFNDAAVRRNPNLAVSMNYFQGEEQDRLSRELTPVSREYDLQSIRIAQDGLRQLAAFDRAALTPAQRQSADVLRWQLQSTMDGAAALDYSFPLQQMSGVNVNLPNALTVTHPLNTPRDAENYLARLKQVDLRMQEATAESERQALLGIVPPRFILEATIAQMQRFIAAAPAQNPLVTEPAGKLEKVAAVDAARRAQFVAEATTVVEQEVYPAWRTAITALAKQLPKAGNDAGLWRFPDGQAMYAQQLERFTTTKLTAPEIHAIGRREVARIEFEMDRLFRQLGYNDGSIAAREKKLADDLGFPDTPEGRKRVMTEIDAILADALKRTADSFDTRPKSAVIAQPYPEFRWANAAASYTAPPADGSRPGIFQMPLRPSSLTKFALRTLVYHETVPGHHFQVALSVEDASQPAFRRIRTFGGFASITEGWALYAERFAVEDGWYGNDIAGRLGQLSDALFRARRLVVDTGLHAMGWTRQQAIDYGIEPSEVERYVVTPGQACSYMIGQLAIVDLREKARAKLGPRFSIRGFHNVVLGAGIVPLPVLEEVVNAWVAEAGAGSG
jgi:uncharacterized protein (DUF885 family)